MTILDGVLGNGYDRDSAIQACYAFHSFCRGGSMGVSNPVETVLGILALLDEVDDPVPAPENVL